MERKLTAILAADVVGFSRLVGMDEAGTLADLRAHRDNLIDPKIAEHGGHIVKTIGDGLLVVFSSVVAAVECAAAIQRGMVERNRDVPGHGTIEFGSREANAAAREMFETVFRLQPDSPVGPAYLCFTFWVDAFRGWAASKEQSLAQAALWADKAIKLRGSNGLAHIVLASVHLLNRRHEEALATCYKAVELRPNCPTANSYLANILCYCGRPSEAIAKVQEAMRITPVFPPWYMTLLAAAYRDTGEIAKSISAAGHSLKLNPGDCDALLVLCSNYSLLGQHQQAGKLAQEIVAIEPKFSLGRYAESQPYKDEEALARLIESLRAAGLPQ